MTNTNMDFGGECSAREEWLPVDHPDRIAWERRRQAQQEATYVERAREFHEAYERLAPSFGYTTRLDTRDFDPHSKNGKLMIAVMKELS